MVNNGDSKSETTVVDQVITSADIQSALEEDMEEMKAVYGSADSHNCSYSVGYLKRQPLYSCLTCAETTKQPAAICYACQFRCHAEHELVELYTKRNTRCDCGNSRSSVSCKILPDKEYDNPQNKYNQNFQDKFCTCSRPYPETDETVETADDEMLECVICEDWYHPRHLKPEPPSNEDTFDEVVCNTCSTRLPFLSLYAAHAASKTSLPLDTPCRLASLKTIHSDLSPEAALFVPYSWRILLCQCDSCKELYTENEVSFLIDPEDTHASYEAKSSKTSDEICDEMMNAQLNNLDHVARIEVIRGINDFKESFAEFLQVQPTDEAGVKRTIERGDIEQFFEGLAAKRRRFDDEEEDDVGGV